MGAMFKVLAISDPSLSMLVGFADEDPAMRAVP
jgi:hypothetical protein